MVALSCVYAIFRTASCGGQERAAKQGTPRIASFTAFRNTTESCVIKTHMKSSCGDRGSRSQNTTATTDAFGTQRALYTSEGPTPHKLPQGSERTRGQNQRRKYPQNVFNSNGSKRPLCLVKDFLKLNYLIFFNLVFSYSALPL